MQCFLNVVIAFRVTMASARLLATADTEASYRPT